VGNRGSGAAVTWFIGTGPEEFRLPAGCLFATDLPGTISSTKVFHSPQLGHFPIQRGDSLAQDWQTYFECVFDMLPRQYTDAFSEIQ